MCASKLLPSSNLLVAVDHVTPQPGESLLEAFECWQEAADKQACCDYSLHVDIPQWNEEVKDELELLAQEKGASIPSSWVSKLRPRAVPVSDSRSSSMLGQFHKNNGDRFRNNLERNRNPLI